MTFKRDKKHSETLFNWIDIPSSEMKTQREGE